MKPTRIVTIKQLEMDAKIPEALIHGKTMVIFQRGGNDTMGIRAGNPKQMLKILRGFEEVVRDTIVELEGRTSE